MTATVRAMPVDPALARRLTLAARKATEWRAERDRLIVQAVAEGGGVREVARLVGLTHPSILKMLKRGAQDDASTTGSESD